MKTSILLKPILFLLCIGIALNVHSQIIIYSGFEGASNYHIANDIKSIYSDSIDVRISTGSIDNLDNLKAGDVGFVQYDVLQQELLLDLTNATKKTENVSVLLPLGNEEIHLVAKTNSKEIKSFSDLNDESIKVSIGSEGQGTSITSKIIKDLTGSTWTDVHLDFNQSIQALLKGEIDAFFFVGATPVAKLKVFSKLAPHQKESIKLLPISHEKLEGSYAKSKIHAGTYGWAAYSVDTYSVKSFLVTRTTKETKKDRNDIKRLLVDIKVNILKLQSKGHPQWLRVNFNYKGINWEIHEVAKKLFIDIPKKENGKKGTESNHK